MSLTIFDLDATLFSDDSDYEWGQFLVKKGIVDAEQYTKKNNQFYEGHKNKTLLKKMKSQIFLFCKVLALKGCR